MIKPPPVIAVTMGEPAGIGGEITLKAWAARIERRIPPFFLIGDIEWLRATASGIAADVPIAAIAVPEDAPSVFASALPVLPQPLAAAVTPAKPRPENAGAVIGAIDAAVEFALAGRASAIVTNPIHKATLYAAGFEHPGHTEYLAELAGANTEPVMMLTCAGLRVVPVTVHRPLREAIADLDSARIVSQATIVYRSLQSDFGLPHPRLAVAGLNPHASEDGALGDEERTIIQPAVAELGRRGWDVCGPLAPDSMFHAAARASYDAAICMYHDQALIPLKTIDFLGGVNVTLGLPFVRTSPDHGTAFDIAGRGRADPASFIAALALADQIATQRRRAMAPSGA